MSTAVNWLYTFQSIPGRPAGAGPEKKRLGFTSIDAF